jgi:hypothetical protein
MMNKEQLLELVTTYPEVVPMLKNEYRVELLKEYANSIDRSLMNKTQEAADLYKTAKAFNITQPLKPMMEILDVKLSTINRRLHMAREAGLVIKISGDQKRAS